MTTASASLANSDLPGPTSSLNGLLNAFSNKGLSSTDMVALSGTHTCYASPFPASCNACMHAAVDSHQQQHRQVARPIHL